MARVKPKRHGVVTDMTAMCDVTFLLLTFFIMTTQFKKPDVEQIKPPTSISEKLLPDGNLMTVNVTPDGKFYFAAVENFKERSELLDKMGAKYGVKFSEEEKDKIIEIVSKLKAEYLVISGSLNEGLPKDFYQKIAETAKASGIKVIVDTSGEPLQKVLETGVYMIKPNIGELAKLVGKEHLELNEIKDAAKEIIAKGGAEIVVVSLGPQGAVLVTKDEYEYVPAPNVRKKSTVGAGDSMVGGLTWALSQNKSLKEVIRWGVACGSAATMNEGTQLFKKEDAVRLFEWLKDR